MFVLIIDSLKMKILMVNEGYPPFSYGGAETYLRYLSEELVKRGHSVHVIIDQPNISEQINGVNIEGMEFGAESRFKQEYIGRWNDVWYTLNKSALKTIKGTIIPKTAQMIRAINPDIVHIHNIHNYSFYHAIITASRIRSVPVIWTVHDYWLLCPINTLLPLNKRCMVCEDWVNGCKNQCLKGRDKGHYMIFSIFSRFKHVYKFISRIIAPSDYMKKMLIKYGVEGKRIVCIPNAVPDIYGPDIIRKKHWNKIHIGFIGHGPHKGLDILLEAIKNMDTIKVTLVSNIMQNVDVREGIKILNNANTDEMRRFFEDVNVIVLPSIWAENCSMALIEGMMSGNVCIASALGGNSEIIEDGKTGFLFQCGNVIQLRRQLEYLNKNPAKLKVMALFARNRAKVDYNILNHTDRIIEVYKEMVT